MKTEEGEAGGDAGLSRFVCLEGPNTPSWLYKAEGAANVTFSYVGEDVRLQGTVLRVRKGTGKRSRSSPSSSSTLFPSDPLDFARTVMRPLLGPEYVVPGIALEVPPAFLAALDEQLASAPGRPLKRSADRLLLLPPVSPPPTLHAETAAPHGVSSVVLMLDHSRLTGLLGGQSGLRRFRDVCVEIKPKSGVGASAPSAAAEEGEGHAGRPPAPLVSRTCRFCTHQVTKALEAAEHARPACACRQPPPPPSPSASLPPPPLAPPLCAPCLSAAAHAVSGYCPLDLYSHEPGRVTRALSALLASPQNNFRVFLDGAPVFTSESTAAEGGEGRGTTEALSASLAHLNDALAGLPGLPDGHEAQALLALLAAVLVEDRVLDRVREAQERGGEGEREGEGAGAGSGRNGPPFTLASVGAVYARYEAAVRAEGEHERVDALVESRLASLPSSHPDAVCVRSFLRAQTAKDISLLVAMRLADEGEGGEGTGAGAAAAPADEAARPGHPGTEHMQRRIGRVAVSVGQGGGEGGGGSIARAVYSVSVVDVDAKPAARIPGYVEQERLLVETFEAYGEAVLGAAGKRCAGR
jgi:hypothetical protein